MRFTTEIKMVRSLIKNRGSLEEAIVASAVEKWISTKEKKKKETYQLVKEIIMREKFWKEAEYFNKLVTPAVKLLRLADDKNDDSGRALEPMGEVFFKSYELQEHYKNLTGYKIPKTVLTSCSRSFNDKWSLYHNEYHSVGWILNPLYRRHEQHSNKDVILSRH